MSVNTFHYALLTHTSPINRRTESFSYDSGSNWLRRFTLDLDLGWFEEASYEKFYVPFVRLVQKPAVKQVKRRSP
jgi:hypothetical protein